MFLFSSLSLASLALFRPRNSTLSSLTTLSPVIRLPLLTRRQQQPLSHCDSRSPQHEWEDEARLSSFISLSLFAPLSSAHAHTAHMQAFCFNDRALSSSFPLLLPCQGVHCCLLLALLPSLVPGLVSGDQDRNPSPGWSYPSASRSSCVPLRAGVCHRHRVGYTHTCLPNSMGRTDQERINQELLQFDKLVGVKCYPLLPLFLCSIYAPKCIPSTGGYLIPPCRSLCHGQYRSLIFPS